MTVRCGIRICLHSINAQARTLPRRVGLLEFRFLMIPKQSFSDRSKHKKRPYQLLKGEFFLSICQNIILHMKKLNSIDWQFFHCRISTVQTNIIQP